VGAGRSARSRRPSFLASGRRPPSMPRDATDERRHRPRRAETRRRPLERAITRVRFEKACASAVLKAMVQRNDFDTSDVDDIVWGTSAQIGEQVDARHFRAHGRCSVDWVMAQTFVANYAAHAAMAGMEDLVVPGGIEMMSLPKKGTLPTGANVGLSKAGGSRPPQEEPIFRTTSPLTTNPAGVHRNAVRLT
jgi:acetyl-CoA acetyltransferase